MKLRHSPLLKENKTVIKENVKQAKQYVEQGKITPDDLKQFIEIDPSPTRKYVGWMAKQWINKTIDDWDILRSTVEEYHTFAERGKTKEKDIGRYKTFQQLADEVEELNQTGAGLSLKDLESDYDVVKDDDKLFITVPHTHEASRKLGLKYYAFRPMANGEKDCAWCTTYKTPAHFADYYYNQGGTLYYILVKDQELVQQLEEAFVTRKYPWAMQSIAILVKPSSSHGFDAMDQNLNDQEISKFRSIVGI